MQQCRDVSSLPPNGLHDHHTRSYDPHLTHLCIVNIRQESIDALTASVLINADHTALYFSTRYDGFAGSVVVDTTATFAQKSVNE